MPKLQRSTYARLLGAALLAAAGWGAEAQAAQVANPYGVAVIVGNRSYTHERVPKVAYAHRDADAFRRFVLEVLGFDPENIIDLRDATQAEMETTFGNERHHEGTVWSYLHPRHGSDVVVFYSGHGVPGLKDQRGYLLPVNADPDTAEINGYPIDVLYANLGKLEEANSVRVFLDACFSGDSDRGMLVRSASPVYVQAALPEASANKLTVLAAASGNEVASWDEEAEHGLFTHHLLDALYGAGDADGDGQVTASEAKTYLDDTMTLAARRRFKRRQNASLNGTAHAVLASAGAEGAFPPRAAGAETEATQEEDPVAAEVETVAVVEAPPAQSAEETEAALGLTRAERKLVQRSLAALEFDVGVADGMFGRRTRAAIVDYQKSKGLVASGYLDAEITRTLLAVAEELAAGDDGPSRDSEEAERLEVERLAAEREFWVSVKGSEDPQQLNAYLEAYPYGIYEKLARQRRDALLEAQDDAAFQRAESLGTAEAFGEYLSVYPDGRHADNARNRQLMAQAESESAEAGVAADGAQSVSEWEPGTVFQDCPECPEMVVLPRSTSGRIAVGRYEVTFSEWDACRKAGTCSHNPHDRNWGRGRRPVINVNWRDTQEYVRWLSEESGKEYRLLSESEWDFVTHSLKSSFDRYRFRTSPIGSTAPNAYGMYDVAGNVWEWSGTCWQDDKEKTSDEHCSFLTLRGGVWSTDPYPPGSRIPRSPERNSANIEGRYYDTGFRVAATLD